VLDAWSIQFPGEHHVRSVRTGRASQPRHQLLNFVTKPSNLLQGTLGQDGELARLLREKITTQGNEGIVHMLQLLDGLGQNNGRIIHNRSLKMRFSYGEGDPANNTSASGVRGPLSVHTAYFVGYNATPA